MLKEEYFNKLKSSLAELKYRLVNLLKKTKEYRLLALINFTNLKQFPWFPDMVLGMSAYVDAGKHAMECYFSDSQGGGFQLFVLEGYRLLKPDSTWMDLIHFHHSTLRETFRRLSYYQHFTLKRRWPAAMVLQDMSQKPSQLIPMHSKP